MKVITPNNAQWIIDEVGSYSKIKLASMWAMDIVLNKEVGVSDSTYQLIKESGKFDKDILDNIFGVEIEFVKATDLALGECILSKDDLKDFLILRTSIGFVDLHELGWGVTNINPLTKGEKVKLKITYDKI